LALYGEDKDPPAPPHSPDPSQRLYIAASGLDSASRENIVKILDHYTPIINTERDTGMQGFKKIGKILTAPTLDTEQLNTIFEEMASRRARVNE
tara:strand:+ start:163 stop:444 length:282 start_codon:yes stop_codon:yes gene_type:complete